MPSFPIVDSHVHLWDPAVLPYAWQKTVPSLDRAHLPGDYDAACAGAKVGAMVFVECDIDAPHSLDEIAWIDRQAALDPRIAAFVAHAPVETGANVLAHLEKLATFERVRGVRRLIQSESDLDFCVRPPFIAGVKELERLGWTFDICIKHNQMESAIRLVDACPHIQFVLDHLGKPNIKDAELQPWGSHMRELALRDNVVCKLSGVATEADHAHWTREQLRPFILTALEAFGPGRLMFGGDWPVSTLAIGYTSWLEVVDWTLGDLTGEELERVYVTTAEQTYGLPVRT